MSNGWEAHVTRHLDPLQFQMFLFRRGPDETEVMTSLSSGTRAPSIEMVENDSRLPGIWIPDTVFHPLRDAMIAAGPPLPSSIESRLLEEALNYERARVDSLIQAAVGRVSDGS